MSKPNDRFPDAMLPEIIMEAVKLHDKATKATDEAGFTSEDIEDICKEAGIPTNFAEEAIRKITMRKRKRKRQKKRFYLNVLRLFYGFMDCLPPLALSFMVYLILLGVTVILFSIILIL